MKLSRRSFMKANAVAALSLIHI
ncbi:twin-arginine translocation signal domain-containing protein [Salmonella enterica]